MTLNELSREENFMGGKDLQLQLVKNVLSVDRGPSTMSVIQYACMHLLLN